MEAPNFKKLYEPYAAIASLEQTLTWVLKECTVKGIPGELAQKAINLTFLEMAGGKEFPVDGGDTGFTNIPHAVLNIYIVKKANELQAVSMDAYAKATQGVLGKRIAALTQRETYVEYLKRKSPVVKFFTRE